MAEVIDVEIVSAIVGMYKDINKVFEYVFNDRLILKDSYKMDSWLYDNLSKNDNNLIDNEISAISNNIITIKFDSKYGEVGTYIEKRNVYYVFEWWFNPNEEISDYSYMKFKDEIAKRFTDNIDCDICGVGREVVIDFDNGIVEAISTSKNFDVWIINKDTNEFL